jgi:hypothetical protein
MTGREVGVLLAGAALGLTLACIVLTPAATPRLIQPTHERVRARLLVLGVLAVVLGAVAVRLTRLP